MGIRVGRAKALVGLRHVRPVLSRSYGLACYISTQKGGAPRLINASLEYYSVGYTRLNHRRSSVARELHVYQVARASLRRRIAPFG
jgi:hypothetical protein